MIKRDTTSAVARAGFTLMEMLVVVAILVVLAGAAVPIYLNYLEDSKLKRARIDIETISKELQNYKTIVGHYPNSLNDLSMPWQLGDGSTRPPTLRPQNLMDPWDHPYSSTTPNVGPNNGMYQIPDVWSEGPDGANRIGNWGKVH
jgi:general secretion pathway protein G